MISADVELEHAWGAFMRAKFPDVAGRDAVVDLAAYDAAIAGIVSRVVGGDRIPDDSREDPRANGELRAARIAELGDPAVTQYLQRLERLIDLAVRADASRSVAGR